MLIKIIDELKTLSVKNVVCFGSASLPAPPYTVVKPEADLLGGGRRFRIIAHFLPDQQLFMEDYITREVYKALNKFKAVDRHGKTNQLKADSWSDIIPISDDGTISMEIVFLMPMVPIIQY